MHTIQTPQQVLGSHLLLVVSVYVARAQNSLYHFRTVLTHGTFGLLAIAAFLESSIMPTAD